MTLSAFSLINYHFQGIEIISNTKNGPKFHKCEVITAIMHVTEEINILSLITHFKSGWGNKTQINDHRKNEGIHWPRWTII